MAVSDDILRDKLRSYTRRVAASLTYEEGIEHHRAGTSRVEYEGADSAPDFLTFSWEILDITEVVDGERCIRLYTHVCDNRISGLGSVYTPLCCAAWICESGRVDFHPLGNLAASREQVDF
jgi:hypothetical protein